MGNLSVAEVPTAAPTMHALWLTKKVAFDLSICMFVCLFHLLMCLFLYIDEQVHEYMTVYVCRCECTYMDT